MKSRLSSLDRPFLLFPREVELGLWAFPLVHSHIFVFDTCIHEVAGGGFFFKSWKVWIVGWVLET